MTRLLALIGLAAAALAALLLWASSRDLREPWTWPAPPEDEDGVQGPDPVTVLGFDARQTYPAHNVEPVSDEEWPDITPYFTARLNPSGGPH